MCLDELAQLVPSVDRSVMNWDALLEETFTRAFTLGQQSNENSQALSDFVCKSAEVASEVWLQLARMVCDSGEAVTFIAPLFQKIVSKAYFGRMKLS